MDISESKIFAQEDYFSNLSGQSENELQRREWEKTYFDSLNNNQDQAEVDTQSSKGNSTQQMVVEETKKDVVEISSPTLNSPSVMLVVKSENVDVSNGARNESLSANLGRKVQQVTPSALAGSSNNKNTTDIIKSEKLPSQMVKQPKLSEIIKQYGYNNISVTLNESGAASIYVRLPIDSKTTGQVTKLKQLIKSLEIDIATLSVNGEVLIKKDVNMNNLAVNNRVICEL